MKIENVNQFFEWMWVCVCLARLRNICFRCSWYSLPINVLAVNCYSTFLFRLAAFCTATSDESLAIWKDSCFVHAHNVHGHVVAQCRVKCRSDIISDSIQIMQKPQISCDSRPGFANDFLFSPFFVYHMKMEFSYNNNNNIE